MPDLSCFYSLSSPWAYLGGPRLQDIVRRHRARLVLKPFDFQEVVPKTGGVPIRTRPQPRRDYHAVELARWRDYLGLPLNVTPRHYPMQNPAPNWNKHAGWTVIAAQAAGLDAFPLSHAILRALWAEERDIADPAVRRAIADENGYDGAALVAAEGSEAVQAQYRRNGEEAEALGVFGSPTLVLDGELFWGQDRLGFLDRALARRAAARN
ncbi:MULTISPECIES: 2-hydroxychromene-2-carboxylate isomerase [Methylobacterium]|uniref:2-hydroxychromene-2-carboxylate isomerase n=1 Tax=Methylobacterium TaxID=407 RepID=UPI0008E8FC22|nr:MULTISPECIES: 2-hydroxychromene-2-carboxylate isomerase [Methylobacterium]MBZ6415852.1 2-hydroxychromene-2-carboxylate isomerase [Methylobacterium sp.]MBK3395193.1 2-hydroxychromene-2-carboxylate isomerase [Methylobacterium ajmalii]MBK3411200.1 2-hydroxychromene-2-carboxylate isomerase [Methylobacterium ajmalii]MBK3424034.1 2-hydroxychromene-2-carboxylate isomerase [Methylobacterium ajmalii]SFF39844.1 2-hydroxychromene-2-carboxylate isomerase [Methylobacterium sp. yr596]